MEALRLWARYTAASIRAQLQYPGSMALMSFGQFLATIVDFLGLAALFTRFGHIGGWSLGQVCVFYATISFAFAVADTITRGFDVFGTEFVKTGAFDRLLLRPRT